MAIDLVVRPEGGCVTLVHDREGWEPEALSIDAWGRATALAPGGDEPLGELAESMLVEARLCTRAVCVGMDGWRVASARPIPLLIG